LGCRRWDSRGVNTWRYVWLYEVGLEAGNMMGELRVGDASVSFELWSSCWNAVYEVFFWGPELRVEDASVSFGL
jgi:hypothetical protein